MTLGEWIGYVSDRWPSTVLFSIGVGGVFAFWDFAADAALIEAGLSPKLHSSVQAAIVGTGAFVLSIVLLLARRKLRRSIARELTRISELNHSVRNSLQIISYAQFTSGDPAHKKIVSTAISEIDATLKRLFPTLGAERRRKTLPSAARVERRSKAATNS